MLNSFQLQDHALKYKMILRTQKAFQDIIGGRDILQYQLQ